MAALDPERLHLAVPQPPYGRDGQRVRITSVQDPREPSERELLAALEAHLARWPR
ncbi:hypothetical protein [Kineococcus sp. SYSU DK006]|uniref:hypothetical protein n=1 Tax=Kineococcus sp. SYSU DK006 TaxID=3383127 RepID=UPI003D7EDEC3